MCWPERVLNGCVLFFLKANRACSKLISMFFLQDNSCFLGGRAKDCEKGFEDSKDKGKASLKELKCVDDKAIVI